MRRLARRLGSDAGFSLTEMLVVLVFLGVISAAFSMLFSSTIRHQDEIEEQSVTQGELRAGVDRMISEARGAYIGTGASPIEAVSSSQFTFTVPDKASSFRLVRVSYRVASGQLQRAFEASTNTGGPPWTFAVGGTPTNWAPVVSNVTSPTPFSFYDAAGATTTTPASVRTVAVNMTFANKTASSRTYAYSTRVSLRTTE
jgi:prepilin-type N-terminal cleavage/methylation domain-containing protein